MTTLLSIFIISLLSSLVLTPLSGAIGKKFGALDIPDDRKTHNKPIPRIGGLSIFITFNISIIIILLIPTDISKTFTIDKNLIFFFIGSCIVFFIGLYDDFKRLGPKIKLLFQILGASVAYYGGIRIEFFRLGSFILQAGVLSYFITIFWFLIFINAINLIDGLDGLAAGISFFATMVLIFLLVLRKEYEFALLFTGLSGAILGFLRYNFHPASVFMGDSGSYFLGYSIAGLSIIGSVKSQVGVAILIPIIALGIPIFDTIISPIRRFLIGAEMFKPDRGHIHHRLLDKGFSDRRTVLFMYGGSIILCLLAIVLVNIRNEQAGLFLVILGSGSIIFIRKIGYFDYIESKRLYGWLKDVSDEAGLTRERRSFLNIQYQINKSNSVSELWEKICVALEKLNFDKGSLCIDVSQKMNSDIQDKQSQIRYTVFHWTRNTYDKNQNEDFLFKIELPLLNEETEQYYGKLTLINDIKRSLMTHYTLKRVEHLRRTINRSLNRFYSESISEGGPFDS